MGPAARGLLTRVITAVVLLVVLLVVLFSGNWLLFCTTLVVFFAAAAWEMGRLFGNRRQLPGTIGWTALFAFLLWRLSSGDASKFTALFGLCAAIWAIRLLPALGIGLPPQGGLGNRLINGIYGIALLGCFIAIANLFSRSAVYLLSVMAIVWVADIGAYFAGKAFGKHKLAPSISPGKSWEGAIGGWLAVLALGTAAAFVPPLSDAFPAQVQARWGWLGLILVLSLLAAASVVGDLFESQLKRRAGFKDSSNLLPGHGGILDRIDALVPVLPLAVLFSLTT
ncbi:MAG: phosphatidate cytidylyltransferase [Herminiimonas sp.]|nr:phosphatidate cytidylyltransferase [Herminiimonas sp.]MDB5853853.1 phosphatidate cytidylyltransferase [Herminiimonas sp.]